MKKLLLIVLSGLFLVAGCKKEEFELPEDAASETPVFSVKGTIGEQAIDMVAGIDGAYMETSIQKSNGIEFFTGKMNKNTDAFTLSVSNGNIGLTPSFPVVMPSGILFAYPSQLWASTGLSMLPDAENIQSVQFSVNGALLGESLSIDTPGQHKVCADIVFIDGTSRTVCNDMLLGYKDHGAYTVRSSQSENTVLWLETVEQIQNRKWFVNGQLYSENSEITLYPGNGIVEVKTVVSFANGIVREHTVLIDTEGEGRNFPDFETFKLSVEEEYLNDFKLSVVFQDDGTVFTGYTTADVPGELIVNSISLFKEKPNGNKVYKVFGTINGKMYNTVTGELLPSYLEVVFALELPY